MNHKKIFTPMFSVIIPVGRPERAHRTLCALAIQQPGKYKMEIIIAGQDLKSIQFEPPDGIEMKTIFLPSKCNPATTRNAAIKHACGDWLVMIDDDVEPTANFLEVLADFITNHPQITAVGARLPSGGHTYWARCVDLVNFPSQQTKQAGTRKYLYSAALAVSLSAFNQAGGYNPDYSYGEDVDLCIRLNKIGGLLWYEPNLTAIHHHYRYSFHQATQYVWKNGGLATFLFRDHRHSSNPVLAFFQHFIAATSMSVKMNRCYPLYLLYGPGVVWLSLVFAFSLEFTRRRTSGIKCP